MEEIKISVIVSIYQVEAYIHESIESLLRQTGEGLEFLLIDDGSKDACGRIIEEYARKDSRIRVIHKENSGLADSRNLGVREARGEYVGFADPDDWYEPDFFESLYRRARETDADVVVCGFQECYEDTGARVPVLYHFLEERAYRGSEVQDTFLAENIRGRLHSFAWNKLYRRSVLLEKEITSPKEMHLMQDSVFALRLFSQVECASYLARTPYYFRRHSASNSMKYRPDTVSVANRLYREKMEAIAACLPGRGDLEEAVLRWYLYYVGHALFMEGVAKNGCAKEQRIERLHKISQMPEFRANVEKAQAIGISCAPAISFVYGGAWKRAIRISKRESVILNMKKEVKKFLKIP